MPKIWEETHLREIFYGTLTFQQTSVICIGRHVGGQGGLNYFLSLQEDLWYSEKSVGFLSRAFFKLFVHTKIVALHAAALGLLRVLHLTFRGVVMIFFAKSILTSRFSHFPHPLLTILFSHQYGEVIFEWMDWQFVCNLVSSLLFWVNWMVDRWVRGHAHLGKFEI